jgi:hypothetical protein
LSLQQPTRIAIFVRGNSSYHEQSTSIVTEHALQLLGIAGTPHAFLACENWGRTIIYLLDIFHESYIFESAHHVCDMTVIMVSLGGRNEKKWLALPAEKKQVNEGIAKLHNLNGWDTRPPYFANHDRGAVPVNDSPRDATML